MLKKLTVGISTKGVRGEAGGSRGDAGGLYGGGRGRQGVAGG